MTALRTTLVRSPVIVTALRTTLVRSPVLVTIARTRLAGPPVPRSGARLGRASTRVSSSGGPQGPTGDPASLTPARVARSAAAMTHASVAVFHAVDPVGGRIQRDRLFL